LLTTILSTWLGAATYVVDHDGGDDAAAGTEDAPFQTIARGVKKAGPGDTVLIRAGVYRETVAFGRSGKQGQRITLKAADGQRAILSGAELLSGWEKCTADDVQDNPHFARILRADLDWVPDRLFEGTQQLTCARTPDAGWWSISEGLSLTEFVDTKHLTQTDPHAWDGWNVAILEQAGGGLPRIPVAAFDPKADKITLARPYSRYRKKINEKRDRYYMENHISALNGPGQYVIVRQGSGCRIFVWPRQLNSKKQPEIEAPRRNTVISITGISHVMFDGLEVSFSRNAGIGSSMAKDNRGVIVQNCFIHHNGGYGIQKRRSQDFVVRRNVIRHNSHGVVMSQAVNALIEGNDVGFNGVDGVIASNHCKGVTIRRNYIHDHIALGHPDNVQFWTDVQDLTIEDNVLFNAGQTMMSAGLKRVKLINNIWAGSHAVSMIVGAEGAEIRNNTIAAVSTPTNWSGKEFSVRNNIIAPLHDRPCYGIPDQTTFAGNNNLLWNGKRPKMPLVILGRWKAAYRSLKEIQDGAGQETRGIVAKPLFRKAPKFYTHTHYAKIPSCTASRLVLHTPHQGLLAVGDHLEVNFDGKLRRATRVGPDWVEFAPPLPEPPVVSVSVCNWGEETQFDWDLRLADGSPGKAKGADGRDIGCDLDIQAYIRGDFDGDGVRDLPAAP